MTLKYVGPREGHTLYFNGIEYFVNKEIPIEVINPKDFGWFMKTGLFRDVTKGDKNPNEKYVAPKNIGVLKCNCHKPDGSNCDVMAFNTKSLQMHQAGEHKVELESKQKNATANAALKKAREAQRA
jgi:hypothetical protein